MRNYYKILGIGLSVGGAVFAPISYFIIDSVPLTAVGLSALMIGFTCVALANARSSMSPEVCQLMLRTGMENIASLLEELGLTGKAIYIPSGMGSDRPQALVPLVEESSVRIHGETLSGRLIVRYGPNPDDMAVSITTPGSVNIDMLETKPGPDGAEIEQALNYILAGVLDIADSARVSMQEGRLEAEISNPKMIYEDIWYYRSLGSPVASIVATIVAEAFNAPVRIIEENPDKKNARISLEVLS